MGALLLKQQTSDVRSGEALDNLALCSFKDDADDRRSIKNLHVDSCSGSELLLARTLVATDNPNNLRPADGPVLRQKWSFARVLDLPGFAGCVILNTVLILKYHAFDPHTSEDLFIDVGLVSVHDTRNP